jgi:DNA-binding NarL/FixJ family response regulator
VRAPEDRRGGKAADAADKVLVVEDEYFVALDLESILIDAGLEVIGIATSADDAVRLAEERRPMLVVMDIRLIGERDGVDAAVEIYRRLGIRCIFASAHRDPTTVARASSAHALGWVAKPYTPAILRKVVKSALEEVKKGGSSS